MVIAFHKPYGVLSQFTPEPGSKWRTLSEFGFPPNVYPLGRLDADSEGLLLLSDEKGVNSQLLNPEARHERTYWAQVEGVLGPDDLQKLKEGLLVEGRRSLPCKARLLEGVTMPERVPPVRSRKAIPTAWVELTLVEGKNRQVRRMTAAIGFPTLRLIRVRVANVEIGILGAARWREVTGEELRGFRNSLGSGHMESDRSVGSVGSKRLRPSGGYRELRSFKTATIIYDATVAFCERFIEKRSRLVDQMVQAARSGRQNIAEGSRASATSSQTELRLMNVARASLDELLLDYEDFLRQRGLKMWSKEDPEALAVRALGNRTDPTDQSDPYSPWLRSADPGQSANALICLIHQTNYLLDQQIRALERDFVSRGGYSEQLAAARLAERGSKPGAPSCPKCGKPMALRTARKGVRSGSQFWGCVNFPKCSGVRPL